MRKAATTIIALVLAVSALHAGKPERKKTPAQPPPKISIARLVLKGEILDDENISFDLTFKVDAAEPGNVPILQDGNIVKTSSEISGAGFSFIPWARKKFSIFPRAGSYYLHCPETGKRTVRFSFFSEVQKKNAQRSTTFNLLPAISRIIEIKSHRKNIELKIPGAFNVVKKDDPDGDGLIFSAALPPKGDFKISWRSQIADLKSSLVTSVTPIITHSALPGSISTNAIFNYKVIQGKLSEITLAIPDDVNILAVKGEDIQVWNVEKTGKGRELRVKLGREFKSDYVLKVSAEKILPKFPCAFSIPDIAPKNVLRINGFLAVGAAGTVKLIVEKTSGLSQIDSRAFPMKMNGRGPAPRDLYTYRFSGADYSIAANADNITPSYTVELEQTVSFKDEEMRVQAKISLDVKDAPIRELTLEYPADMMVNKVTGRFVKSDDYDIIPPKKAGEPAKIKIPFQGNSIGKIDVTLECEKNIRGKNAFPIPAVRVENPKSVRGYLLLAADRGISIAVANTANMRKIHPSLAPTKTMGLQLAYKFKGQKWSGNVAIAKDKTSFVADAFHLATIGEASIYGSTLISYRISGAPVDEVLISLDNSYKNPEFTGASIIDWKKISSADGRSSWRVKFKSKLFGTHEILATYETPLPRSGKAEYVLGGATLENAEAETGFLAVSSARNIKASNAAETPPSIIEIESTELPKDYRDGIHNPILKAYKYNKAPSTIKLAVTAYTAEKLIPAAIDYASLETRVDANGEIVTDVEYRLKNSSRQSIAVTLPENAKLWTVEVDGKRKRVSESPKKKGEYLIPIPRKKDTDKIIAVSITYACKLDRQLDAAATIPLDAPTLDVETMAMSWKISVPEKYDFTGFDGNMIPSDTPRLSGLEGLYEMSSRWIALLLARGALFPWLLLLVSGALAAYSWGAGRLRIFLTFLGGLGAFSAVLWIGAAFLTGPFPNVAPPPVNIVVFSKLFAPEHNTAHLALNVENMRASSFMTILGLCAKLAAAAAALAYAIKKQSAFLTALGTVLVLWGFSRWISFNAAAALALPAFAVATTTILIWIAVFKRAKTKKRDAKPAAAALVAVATALATLISPSNAKAADTDPPPVVVENATYAVAASKDQATADASFEITVNRPGEALIVSKSAAIIGELPDKSGFKIVRRGDRCFVKATAAGTYEFKLKLQLSMLRKNNGVFHVYIPLPPCSSNKALVNVDGNFDISAPTSVFFKKNDNAKGADAEIAFSQHSPPMFTLSPKERQTKNEELRFFADVASTARFAPGVVEIDNLVNFRIAQGQFSKFSVEIPDATNVVSVNANDLAAWKYNQDSKTLDVFLTQPKKDSFKAKITTQIPNCALPYEKTVGALKVVGAGEQHGTIAIVAAMDVQTRVLKNKGLNQINASDISAPKAGKLKKAFKYFKLPASALVRAVAVEPEIRVKENATVAFGEERTLLISELEVDISKARLFSITLEIPNGFDIDKLQGTSIRNWDEINKQGKRRVVAHFDRGMLGTARIHIEASSEKTPQGETYIPGIKIENARKHKGSLTVEFERGTRMDIRERRGLEVASSDSFARSAGKRASTNETRRLFSILRPDWTLKVSFETARPWVQTDNLQIASISDGAVALTARFKYKIENAGIKHLIFQLPENAEAPEFRGANILQVYQNIDKTWVVALKRKEFSSYALKVKFRLPANPKGKVLVAPVKALNVELQKGFLAVETKDSLRIAKSAPKGDLTPFDPRKIPATFNAGNLSNAVLCFRTVGTDYKLELDIERHKAAKLLRAKINAVDMTSVVSLEGDTVTKLRVRLLNIGNENFLKLKLPENSSLWSALIDHNPETFNPGQSVEVAKDKDGILVPLKQKNKTEQIIEIVYSTPKPDKWSIAYQNYPGPAFDLPLNNLRWTLYLPEKYAYDDFAGTLDHGIETLIPRPPVSIEEYDRYVAAKGSQRKRMSRSWLMKANKAAKSGNFQEANDYFANANNLAIDDNALREDVQGQWKEAQRIVTSNLMRIGKKSSAGRQTTRIQRQSSSSSPSVSSISDKLFEQQRAAEKETGTLIFSIPEQGRKVTFSRTLQMDRNAPMSVSMDATPAFSWEKHSAIYAATILTLLLGTLFKLIAIAKRKPKEI